MSNGEKKVQFNTRERVISNDFNRLQDILQENSAEDDARLYNDGLTWQNPGLSTVNVGVVGGDAPLKADVLGGLFVEVDDVTSLLISKGSVGVVIQDSVVGLDDSSYKKIRSSGVSTLGLLPITTNGGGSRRIDVIECQVVDVVLETDNRDVFDPSTGLFTPTVVNKVVAKDLQYRIRLGTAGNGYPGHAAGWLPLTIASLPAGATQWSEVTFWDVRPLVTERYLNKQDTEELHPVIDISAQALLLQSPTLASNVSAFSGYALTSYGGYLAGGKITKSTAENAGTGEETFANGDVEFISVTDQDNINTLPVGTTNYWLYLAALFPEGLPRWARYSNNPLSGPGKRAPFGSRGLVCLLRHGSDGTIGRDRHVTNGAIPSGTGLLGLADGVVLTQAWTATSSSIRHATMSGKYASIGVSPGLFTSGSPQFTATPAGLHADIDFGVEETNGTIPIYAKSVDMAVQHTASDTVDAADVGYYILGAMLAWTQGKSTGFVPANETSVAVSNVRVMTGNDGVNVAANSRVIQLSATPISLNSSSFNAKPIGFWI